MRTHTLVLTLAMTLSTLSGCSTSFWYTQVQAAQYEKCEKLASAEDRRRCKAETSKDKEAYDKERKAAGTSKL